MRLRRLLFNLAIAAFILLAAEGWASFRDRPPKYRLSSSLGYELSPGWHRKDESINLAGLRGREIGPKRPGSVRILAMGESTTWGHKVGDDETWPVALESELRAATGRDIEVLNGGVSGWGLEHVVIALRQRYLEEFQPDLVLVFTGWNLATLANSPGLEKIRADIILVHRQDGLYGFSLVRLIADELADWRAADVMKLRTVEAVGRESALREQHYPRFYAELARVCAAHGARLAVLRYPALVQRDPPPPGSDARDDYESALRAALGGERAFDELVAFARAEYAASLGAVVTHATAAGIDVLDVAGRMEADLEARGGSTASADGTWPGYFRDHFHFTAEGDAALGRAVSGILVERELLPTAQP